MNSSQATTNSSNTFKMRAGSQMAPQNKEIQPAATTVSKKLAV
jgi:hypothetical protein